MKRNIPATVETITYHIEEQIKSGGQPKYEKLFNLSKNAKEDKPMTGFIEYYAYLTEERKYNLRYNQNSDQESLYSKPIPPTKAFYYYVADKTYTEPQYYITQKQYCKLDFMNQAPEIVCEVIYYLSGFLHHRTDQVSYDAYKEVMRCQVNNISVASKQQVDNYNSEGWK